MGMNITNINTTPINLDLSIFSNTNGELITTASNNANNVTNGWFSIILLFAIFLFMLFELSKENGMFRINYIKATVISSGLTFVFGSILLISTIINNLYVLIWFGLIFLISLIVSTNEKEKGI